MTGKLPDSVGKNVRIGEKTDSALADLVRGLLQKPAEEFGELLGDSIGILGDRIKRKRASNTQLGLEDAGTELNRRKVNLKDITPPDEEELHDVLQGMSLTSDGRIRKLWAGLLATRLDPNGVQNIERPISAVLGALSPSDAQIIEIGAFVTQQNKRIWDEAKAKADISGKNSSSLLDHAKISKTRREELFEQSQDLVASVKLMISEYDLQKIESSHEWADNLVRLGLIRIIEFDRSITNSPKVPSKVELSALVQYVDNLRKDFEQYENFSGILPDPKFIVDIVEHDMRVRLGFEFTRFGEKFCAACGLLD
ncbi:MAG: DUF4393 domain-containing protein [Natronohydrobacter sp.]|nr:DUF4393 domain-containing protein [Natronohydrobacter sp.]